MNTPYDNYRYRSIQGAKVDAWEGTWLTTERFRNKVYRPLLVFNRLPEYATEGRNIHTLFRKNFQTDKEREISSALLYITGDDFYKLYVNSTFVGEGPSQSYPFAYNYNCFDVTDLIKSDGENSIGVHVFYQGLFNIYLISADNSHGMIAQLEITYSDGSRQIIASDKSWRYTESTARSPRYIFGYETQFSEDIDLNKAEKGWQDTDFDISGWSTPVILGSPYPMQYDLFPQITPAVKHECVLPAQETRIEGGSLLDFGKEFSGTLALKVKGNPGDVICIRCGEELTDNGRVRYMMRAGCIYEEFVTLTGSEDFVDFFDYKGFRYAEILAPDTVSIHDVRLISRSYPMPEPDAKFICSNPILNDIWEICAHSVKVGTQDTYLDCPTREKGGFIGDALITAQTHLMLSGDTRIFKKFLTDCVNAIRLFPGLVCHVPTYDISPAADYSLLFPTLCGIYYDHTGDADFLRTLMSAADAVMDYHRTWENPDGLLEGIEHPYGHETFVLDWPENLRDDYDFSRALTGICTAINQHYYGALDACARLNKAIGNTRKADMYSALRDRTKKALLEKCTDPETGLFTDTPDSNHSSLHANALPLFYGIEPQGGYDPIIKLIKEKRLACGTLFVYYLIEGLYRTGNSELAYELISCQDENSWNTMVKYGATTCIEVWHPDMKSNTSMCHPCGSSPILFIIRNIMGIRFSAPDMRKITVSPCIPSKLESMELDLPIADGVLHAAFRRFGETVEYSLTLPEDTDIEIVPTPNINFSLTRSKIK